MPVDPIDFGNEDVALLAPEVFSGKESLSADQAMLIYRLVVRTRIMEERMIKMSKSGQGHFWIGGPGEEAFNICLGLHVKKGEGPLYDYLHLHYRNSATLVAMGLPIIDSIRQMAMTATDTSSLGRNFIGHYAKREWNVVPVTSVIEIQYLMAPGTALMQKRLSKDAISIVTGGDAGTAEGDFSSCMLWSNRVGQELPVLMIVTNNGWGISTSACSQYPEGYIIDRAQGYGIAASAVDGNDPIASWHALARAMHYVRRERKPFLLEAKVSRLYGHSSSSGALRVKNEVDCLTRFEDKLLEAGVLEPAVVESIREEAIAEVEAAVTQTLSEPQPRAEDVEKYTYAPSSVDAVYPRDYTGLPM